MSDAWQNIQSMKNKRNSLREKLQKRKSERQHLLVETAATSPIGNEENQSGIGTDVKNSESDVERHLLQELSNTNLTLPVTSSQLLTTLKKSFPESEITHTLVNNLLNKFSSQKLISTNENCKDGESILEVTTTENSKLTTMVAELLSTGLKSNTDNSVHESTGCAIDDDSISSNVTEHSRKLKEIRNEPVNEIMSLISTPSIREKQVKRIGEEILDLLSKPTTKQRSLTERFRSQGGTQVMEFCSHRTRIECCLEGNENCKKLHFKKIIEPHTEESLGDCSYLNTCFHMDTCKYVHYEVDKIFSDDSKNNGWNQDPDWNSNTKKKVSIQENTILHPPQWVQCDLRFFDTSVLGKFAVVMADPPWDIHMELPYGTLSDDEMRQLGVPNLQDEGLLFLWVTGRAMELGRECMTLWGYEYIDELVWVKTNQLQRIIRTGRTGHWLNHGKEHCLVGMKGNPKNLNRGLDCDVIVSEVRDTSHKPDEIYGIIERLSPGTRKIELFGRAHNVQPNWITLGNQVDGIRLVDPNIISVYSKRYPNGYSLTNTKT
ncbi:N6-adenosine-methyltransferase catalytic subunit isoform X2 [Planococcus citri]|uniref:N6-adenosine-methyltransferase catalytic subunit isoform X2 n=1 Tax=Planococcus citri TaxID=170843 RepID=UPI0031F9E900